MVTYNNGTNDYAISQFLVAKTAGEGNYLTVQSAINAANLIATLSSPQVVWIKPGIYTENLTLYPYVSLAGTGAGVNSQVVGNAIYNGTGTWSASNLSFISNNSSAALSLQGSDTATVNLNLVDFNSGASDGIALECTGSGISTYKIGCTLEAQAGGRCINMSAGYMECFSSICSFTDTASTVSGGTLKYASSDVGDSFVVTSTGNLEFFESVINSGSTLPCINLNGGSTVAAALNTTFVTTVSSTYIVIGSGTLLYSAISCPNNTIIDATVTQSAVPTLAGSISFDGGVQQVSFSGAYSFDGTLTGNTAVTFPTSGTLATTSQIPSLPLSIANGGTDATSFTQSNGIVTYNGTRLVNYAGPQLSSSGVMTNTAQPSFFAYLSASPISNATGDGTTYKIIFDGTQYDQASNYNTGTGTFTAPVSGIYCFGAYAFLLNILVGHTTGYIEIVTTSQSYIITFTNPANFASANAYFQFGGCTYAKMTAGDTAIINVNISGATKTVGINNGSGPYQTYFFGQLVC